MVNLVSSQRLASVGAPRNSTRAHRLCSQHQGRWRFTDVCRRLEFLAPLTNCEPRALYLPPHSRNRIQVAIKIIKGTPSPADLKGLQVPSQKVLSFIDSCALACRTRRS
jgi:hypothetical protein